MKKMIPLILVLMLCLSLFACSSEPETVPTTEPSTTPPTAYEQLSEKEKLLYDALIIMTKNFYEPSAVRILEVGDHDELSKRYSKDDFLFGPDTIVVRLQGENRAGGTVNHYYRVCIVAGENSRDTALDLAVASKATGNMEMYLNYKGEVGEYAELSDYYTIEEDSSDTFNIGRINKALSEYWEDMGF